MSGRRALILGFAAVIASMVLLFSVPQSWFVPATFVSTSCMMAAALTTGGARLPKRPRYKAIVIGAATALVLYGVFFVGAWMVSTFHPFGITSASEGSIYSLISAPTNPLPLQVGVLLFDSAGYESYFRGTLQSRLTPSLGVAAAPAVALLDACIHLITLNILWVGATFVTDTIWGLTYQYGKGSQSSFTSHLIWDLAIFIIRPIK